MVLAGEEAGMEENGEISYREEPDVDEPDCEGATAEGDADLERQTDLAEEAGVESRSVDDEGFDPADAEAVDAALEGLSAADFLAPGGGWGGSQGPVDRAVRIGRANGLSVTSLKRAWGSPGSDHHVGQKSSYAADMSNGSSPTAQMDRTARQIAAALGRPGWSSGVLNVHSPRHRMRAQLIWRWTGHYNHVHFGCRRQ
jgi:hypothetical protein